MKVRILAALVGCVCCAGPAIVAADHPFRDGTDAAGLISVTAIDAAEEGNFMDIGAATGDFDNDGWPDLFVLGGGRDGTADKLYLNNRDGVSFTESAVAWGVAAIHRGHGVAVGDVNGDGWDDLFITSSGEDLAPGGEKAGAHRLYLNTGTDHFVEVAGEAGVAWTSDDYLVSKGAAFGDFDLDGDLDLFVCTWHSNQSTDNDGNRLFRNDGPDGEGVPRFTDVTLLAGIDSSIMAGFSPRFVDMNGDRYPELLVAADWSTSKYWRNDGPDWIGNVIFSNRTDSGNGNGTGGDTNGMGHAVGDLDGDGLLDWYVTSIEKEPAGTPIGNYLYLNQGEQQPDQFVPVVDSGATRGGWGWGADIRDFDHDGDLDIAETNGWRYLWTTTPSYWYDNDGAANFTRNVIADRATGLAAHAALGRTLITADWDRDGDMDLLITTYDGSPCLVLNDVIDAATNPAAGWLKVYLDTDENPSLAPRGVGSMVRATVDGTTQVCAMSTGATYLGSSEAVCHFGLGSSAQVDRLTVEWSDGRVTTLENLSANQELSVLAPTESHPLRPNRSRTPRREGRTPRRSGR